MLLPLAVYACKLLHLFTGGDPLLYTELFGDILCSDISVSLTSHCYIKPVIKLSCDLPDHVTCLPVLLSPLGILVASVFIIKYLGCL